MLWQLMKFRFKAINGKAFIILYAVVLLLVVVLYRIFQISQIVSSPLMIYVIGANIISFFAFFFIMSINSPLFFIQKSDVDFLFMLPLDKKEVVIADSLFTFLSNLLVAMAIGIFFLFPVISYFFILVAILISIMNTFSFFAFSGKRKIVAYIIAAWMISSATMFPFTPFSMIYGYVYGYFILAGLVAMTVFLSIKNASAEDLILEFYKRQRRSKGKD